VETVLLLVLRA